MSKKTYKFNAAGTRDAMVQWIKDTAKEANFSKVVIGISGGKDSTIAAALCCRALGSENVHGLLLPNGVQSDIDDSIRVCKMLGIEYDTINIKPIYDAYILQYALCTSKHEFKVFNSESDCQYVMERFLNQVGEEKHFMPSQDALYNLAPRIRMSMIRLWGQSNHHRMCGTGNMSEITVGYCTKDGDMSNDFNPLARLTSIEVVEVGLTLDELPNTLVLKTPADGLTGMSDEEKLGITYKSIHNYIRAIEMDKDTWYKINRLELASMHKRNKTEFTPSDDLIYT